MRDFAGMSAIKLIWDSNDTELIDAFSFTSVEEPKLGLFCNNKDNQPTPEALHQPTALGMEDLFEMLDVDGGGTLTQDEFLEGGLAITSH